MTDHADTIRRDYGAVIRIALKLTPLDHEPEFQDALVALDALLARLEAAEKDVERLSSERQQAQEERDAALAGAKMPTGYINHLCKERDEARAQRRQALGACLQQRRQAIDALREIADERNAGGEQTTSGASRAAIIARAALVKLGIAAALVKFGGEKP